MEILAIVIGVLVGITTLALTFKPIFGSSEKFFECVLMKLFLGPQP